jgi:SAM-dependent methyltransferase
MGRQGIVIMGMHRSGTSAVAKAVHSWGAYGGEALLPADINNPRGYWEHVPLVMFNDVLLGSVQSSWAVPPDGQRRQALVSKVSTFSDRATALISSMRERQSKTWFWKDPRLSILLPFWECVWQDVVYIITLRNPMDIAESLYARNAFPASASLLIWREYMAALLSTPNPLFPRHFVLFENLIADPAAECRRLAAFLDLWCGSRESGGENTGRMISAIEPEVSRNHVGRVAARGRGCETITAQTEVIATGASLPLLGSSKKPEWRDYLEMLNIASPALTGRSEQMTAAQSTRFVKRQVDQCGSSFPLAAGRPAGSRESSAGNLCSKFRLLKRRGLRRDSSVLDLNCDDPAGAIYLIRYLSTGQYHLLDSPPALAALLEAVVAAGLRAKGPVLIADAGYQLIGGGKGTFDYIIAMSLFPRLTINAIQRFLADMVNALKPGGRAYATFIAAPANTRRYEHPTGRITYSDVEPYHHDMSLFVYLTRGLPLTVDTLGPKDVDDEHVLEIVRE